MRLINTMKCTWQDCTNDSNENNTHRSQGAVWSVLCDEHERELTAAVDGFLNGAHGPGVNMRAWVKASGGAAAMVKRIMP